MSKSDVIELEGKVVEALPNAMFKVELQNKHVILAHVSGRLRMNYIRIVPGDKIKITAAPKGFGSENMSALKMFTPSATRQDIIDFIVGVGKNAGSNPCPPIVLGIGIGGDFEYCALLAKKALCRNVSSHKSVPFYADFECELGENIYDLDIGPQGFGGKTTALAVNIETYPTHIAGLPVAVNVGCHVTRHASAVIE